jgi:hypothetical protein
LPPAERDVITFASVIAEPSERRFWAAVGSPGKPNITSTRWSEDEHAFVRLRSAAVCLDPVGVV